MRTDLAREDGPAATRPGSGPRLRRPAGGVSALVYALIFVTAVSQATIVPLLPTVAHRYGLRASELAWVLTLPSLAMLVTSTPIGVLGDRFGNRRVTLAGGGLLAVAVLAQGVPSLPVLVLGRLLFGVGYGALWTTGLAWLAGLDPGTSARRLGGTVTASAVGSTVGPTLAGVLASRYGFAVPFLVAGGVTAVVAAALVALHGGGGRRAVPAAGAGLDGPALDGPALDSPPGPTGRRAGAAAGSGTLATLRRPAVRAGALTLALSGGVSAVMQLLVPLQLHAAGRSSQDIGLTLSAGAVVYIVISALSVQLGPRITNRRANAAMAALMALALLPALLGSATAWVITALLLTVVPRAVTGTVAYALATGDREEGGPGTGAILGLLNALWAVATVAAPVAAGALKTAFDARTAYAAILVVVVAVAAWLLRDARTEPAAAPAARFGLRRPADRTGSAAGRDWPTVDVHPPADRTPTGQIPVVR